MTNTHGDIMSLIDLAVNTDGRFESTIAMSGALMTILERHVDIEDFYNFSASIELFSNMAFIMGWINARMGRDMTDEEVDEMTDIMASELHNMIERANLKEIL